MTEVEDWVRFKAISIKSETYMNFKPQAEFYKKYQLKILMWDLAEMIAGIAAYECLK